jgi:hypothetical protein
MVFNDMVTCGFATSTVLMTPDRGTSVAISYVSVREWWAEADGAHEAASTTSGRVSQRFMGCLSSSRLRFHTLRSGDLPTA